MRIPKRKPNGKYETTIRRGMMVNDEDNIYYIFVDSPWFPLDNFYESHRMTPITYEGLQFTNSEAAFQAAKLEDVSKRIPFTKMTASESKMVGKDKRRTKLRSDWEQVKYQVMLDIVRDKMYQNEWIADILVETGDMNIEEGNTWNDLCWGVDLYTRKGDNWLGKILMQVREEIKQLRQAGVL
jgi:ribA/ribD-fused uncharacterized protein